MTDAEQLETLRAWPGWSWNTLDPLAAEAATIGRRCEAVEEADRQMNMRKLSRSNSRSIRQSLISIVGPIFLRAPLDRTSPSAQAERLAQRVEGLELSRTRSRH